MDLKSSRFLEKFYPSARDNLIAAAIRQRHGDGVTIFNEGDPADGIYLVLEGEIEIVKKAGRREQVLGSFLPGDYLGEVSLLDGFGRSTGARAKGLTSIARIPREPLLEVLDSEPVALTIGLFQQVLGHLRRTNDRFVKEVVHKEKLSLVGEMASSLMHDLRNPLTGIELAADLITLNHTDDETSRCCRTIRLQCERVVAMAGELLEFSRGEAKLAPARTTTVDFLQQFDTLNGDYFQSTGVEFHLEAIPDEIDIDTMRMLRLLQNLVTNAVEAINQKPGGRIEIRAYVEEEMFHLTLTDNGPGIPDAIRDRLFEPFATHGKKNGTGLGMSIVQNIVTAHRGTITFETAPGRGTTFHVQIPQFRKQTQPLPIVEVPDV